MSSRAFCHFHVRIGVFGSVLVWSGCESPRIEELYWEKEDRSLA
jgi:hypothetical protein